MVTWENMTIAEKNKALRENLARGVPLADLPLKQTPVIEQNTAPIMEHPQVSWIDVLKQKAFAEGGDKDSSPEWIKVLKEAVEQTEIKASEKAMQAIEKKVFDTNLELGDDPMHRGGGVSQRTYLLPRELQRKEFLKAGYTEAPGDYGRVNGAVKERFGDVPVYQQSPDVISRKGLVPVANFYATPDDVDGETAWYADEDKGIINGGQAYPTTVYINPYTNGLYQKGWDLNDYGGKHGWAKEYPYLYQKGANILDRIGSPTVVTTGIQPIGTQYGETDENGALKYTSLNKDDYIYSEIDRYLNKNKDSHLEMINGIPTVIPNVEPIITTKRKRKKR